MDHTRPGTYTTEDGIAVEIVAPLQMPFTDCRFYGTSHDGGDLIARITRGDRKVLVLVEGERRMEREAGPDERGYERLRTAEDYRACFPVGDAALEGAEESGWHEQSNNWFALEAILRERAPGEVAQPGDYLASDNFDVCYDYTGAIAAGLEAVRDDEIWPTP